ncbi:hypothetical protein DJ84_18500 [Halorubrum ezzemoulense]|nr:hypothetical protein DJ84_18500 [Halorubrum ezzemoulense]
MSASAAPSTGAIVRTETPRGEVTLARVVDSEFSASIAAETIVTVEAVGHTWRVPSEDVTPL